MTDHEWKAIEHLITGFSAEDWREAAMRILRSIQEERSLDDRIREQREAMRRLCEALEAMPVARPGDGTV